MATERWFVVDSRTSEPVGFGFYPSEFAAVQQIGRFVERDRVGGRKRPHEVIPFLVPKRSGS